jgi:hypothetical protein
LADEYTDIPEIIVLKRVIESILGADNFFPLFASG